MRYSSEQKCDVTNAKNYKEFFEALWDQTQTKERASGLLLVGGSSSRHETVRRAQAALRMDQLPSYWSHAAVILDWVQDTRRAIGAEVTWEPWRQHLQVAERNAVTLFPLSRYLNKDHYPNLAFASFSFSEPNTKKNIKSDAVDYKLAIRKAVLSPNQDRFRYRFLDCSAFGEAIPISRMDNPTRC